MTNIDQLNIIFDPDAAIKNTKIIDLEMIHAQCRGTPCMHSDEFFQTGRENYVRKMLQKDRKKAICACKGLNGKIFIP